jgi:hypothetical protein
MAEHPAIRLVRTTKLCTRCQQTKEIGQFYRRGDRAGYRAHCKPCTNARPQQRRRCADEEIASAERSKRCAHCQTTKPCSEFHIDRSSSDGRYSLCKACKNVRIRARYAAGPEVKLRSRERQRAFYDDPQNRALRREKVRIRNAEPQRKQALAEKQSAYRRDPENRIKDLARKQLQYQVKCGNIARGPCVICGQSEGRIEGHHKDYSRPLDVVWLCTVHHHHVERGLLCLI